MIMTNKLLPVALIAALIGGSVGAFVMHSSNDSATKASDASQVQTANTAQTAATETPVADFDTAGEQTAYKSGFADGFRSAETDRTRAVRTSNVASSSSRRVVYRSASRRAPQRVYYNYSEPRKRSFWQKHRDKLTVAMGTGAGAAIGGLVGGKKGAAIGALAGAGGSALYTYKLRDRRKRY